MTGDLFDMRLRALRRDRASRRGVELFLLGRMFEDCLDRLSLINRDFERALLMGCPDPAWPERLSAFASKIEIVDPGPLFAKAVKGSCIQEDRWFACPKSFDLCLAVGTLDTVNDLPKALRSIRSALAEDSLLIGALIGGESFPQLRAAMFVADQSMGYASPRVHPRIDPPSLAGLLSAAGFIMPVVDVDRARLSYRGLSTLVADLRAMAGTNLLLARSKRPLTRSALAAASAAFAASSSEGRTIEQIDILNFAAWTPSGNSRLMQR